MSKNQRAIILTLALVRRMDSPWMDIADICNYLDQERTSKSAHWLDRTVKALVDRGLIECAEDGCYYALTDDGLDWLLNHIHSYLDING